MRRFEGVMAVTITVTDHLRYPRRQETVGGVARAGNSIGVRFRKEEDGWGRFCSSDVNYHVSN